MSISVLRDPAEWTPLRHYNFAKDYYSAAQDAAKGGHLDTWGGKLAEGNQYQLALLAQTYNKLETLEGKVDALAGRLDRMA